MMRTNYFLETILIAGRVKTLTAFALLAAMVGLLTFGPPALEPAHAQEWYDFEEEPLNIFTVNSTGNATDKTPGDFSCFTGNSVYDDLGASTAERTLRAAQYRRPTLSPGRTRSVSISRTIPTSQGTQ